MFKHAYNKVYFAIITKSWLHLDAITIVLKVNFNYQRSTTWMATKIIIVMRACKLYFAFSELNKIVWGWHMFRHWFADYTISVSGQLQNTVTVFVMNSTFPQYWSQNNLCSWESLRRLLHLEYFSVTFIPAQTRALGMKRVVCLVQCDAREGERPTWLICVWGPSAFRTAGL